jgi:AcrR family transcriptional regulator
MDKQETKTKLFIAAANLFADKGYYQVSVREICQAAGVTKPVLYYYFKDKEDLLSKLVLEVHSHFNDLFSEYIKPEDSFEENLTGLYNAYLKYAINYPYLIKLSTLVLFSPLPQKIKKMSLARSKEQKKFIDDVFIKGKKEGKIDKNFDTEIVVLSLIGPVSIFLTRSVLVNDLNESLNITLKKYFDFWTSQFIKTK